MEMNGRKAAVGLSLLCALFFCAFAAQSASAAEGKNTTAFTCVEGGGEKDFSDAHCDKKVTPGTGKFGHVAIKVGEATKIVVTNAGTKNETKEAAPVVQKGTIAGIKSEIECKTLSGEGTLTNEEPSEKVHRVRGSITANFSSCTVKKPALGCKVKEPITVSSSIEGVEGLGAGKNEMGLEFKPTGEHFASLVIEGCIIKGTFNVDGTAIATGTPAPTEKFTGATSIFTNAMTKETLKLAGNPAEVESSSTVRMAPVEGKEQNPIALTTVT
jgi:hypothetical protein